jgi:hypothetical protein
VAEHKDHRFEYALYPHAGKWREATVPHEAYAYNNPLIAHVLSAHAAPSRETDRRRLPERLAFVRTADGPIVTALKAPGFPLASYETPPRPPLRQLALRVYEPCGQKSPLDLEFFAGLRSVRRANLLDEAAPVRKRRAAQARNELRPFEIRTMLLRPEPAPVLGPTASLAPEREPGRVHFKHWEHNVGAGPLGFSPLGLSLSGQVATGVKINQGGVTVNELTVGVANSLRRRWRGSVSLEAGPGWRIVPDALTFDLPAGEGAERSVCLVFDSDRRRGLVKARLEHEGQVYQDVLEVGEPLRLEWEATSSGRVVVDLSNPHEDTIEVDLFVVAPHELYGAALVGTAAEGCLEPWRHALQVAPGSRECVEASVPSSVDAWVVVKLAYNGRVEYKMVRTPS